jgi:hypothetical protein
MPTLSQMFATCNSKSQFSRTEGEIYDALNEGGLYVYQNVVKEYSNFFVKFDANFITLQTGIQNYYVPPDCSQIINIAERTSISQNWRQMEPETLAEAMDNTREGCGWWDLYDDNYGESHFKFAGPYLSGPDTINPGTGGYGTGGYGEGGYGGGTGFQPLSITISPAPTLSHFCEVAYTAKWVPIINDKSYVMLPDELTPAMQAFAIAELLRSNSDNMAESYDEKGQRLLNMAMTWVRSRQQVAAPRIIPYLG